VRAMQSDRGAYFLRTLVTISVFCTCHIAHGSLAYGQVRIPTAQEVQATLSSVEPARQLAMATLLHELLRPPVPAPGMEEALVTARQSAPALVRLTQGDDPAVREAAYIALAQVRAPGHVARPVWDAALQSPDPSTRRAVAQALAVYVDRSREVQGRTGIAVRYWLLEDLPQVLPVLARALADKDRRVTTDSLKALQLIPVQLTWLSITPDTEAGKAAALSLVQLCEGLQTSAPSVRQLLSTGPAEIQQMTCLAIEEWARLIDPRPDIVSGRPQMPRGWLLDPQMGPFGRQATEYVQRFLLDVLPGLVEAVKSGNATVRLAALEALEIYGTKGRAAASAVEDLLTDGNAFVRWSAARTLGRIGSAHPPATVERLARLLDDPDGDVRYAAAEAIGAFGTDARIAVPHLTKALASDDAPLQTSVLNALAVIGPDAAPAVPALVKTLQAREARVRRLVPGALAALGSHAQSALPALQAALHDPDPEVRQAAAAAILRILTPAR